MKSIELQSIGFISFLLLMFITHLAFNPPIPENLISEQEQCWLSVGLVMGSAWFDWQHEHGFNLLATC